MCKLQKKYGISEKNVRDWRKKKESLSKMPSCRCANRGKSCKWPHLEKKVEEWVTNNRNAGYSISRGAIRIFALKETKNLGIPEFVASAYWCSWFMKRNNLVLRR